MFNRKYWLAVLPCALLSVGSANATILTFSDLANSVNYADIPTTYGDNVNSLNDGVGSYLMGNGFTPNVTVEYRTVRISDGVVPPGYDHLEFWNSGYGDLQGVAFPITSTGHFGEISLIADPGWFVRLNSFDLGGWSFADHPNATLRIVDEARNILLNYSPTDVEGNNGHSSYFPNVASSVVRIQFGFNDWNIGIDNVNFDQTLDNGPEPIPEPATIALAIGGLVVFAARRRFVH